MVLWCFMSWIFFLSCLCDNNGSDSLCKLQGMLFVGEVEFYDDIIIVDIVNEYLW